MLITFKIYPNWSYLRIRWCAKCWYWGPWCLKEFYSIFIGAMTKKYARNSYIIGSTKISWKKLEFLSLNMPSTCKHQCHCKRWCYYVFHIPSSAWTTPSYVRYIESVNGKVPIGHNRPECSWIGICRVSSNPRWTDHIWQQLSKLTDLYSGQSGLKHIVEFFKFLILIPHSNSYCDNLSAIRKICTDGRHNLGKDSTSCIY